jgi:hypothetical protein
VHNAVLPATMPDRPTPFFARLGNAVSLMGQLLRSGVDLK